MPNLQSTNGEPHRFQKGNPGGGNPYCANLASWRATWAGRITPSEINEGIDQLLTAMRAGQEWAVKYLLDRCLGKPIETQQITSLQVNVTYRDYQPPVDDRS